MCEIVLSEFFHRQNCRIIELRRFRSWILLPLTAEKWRSRIELRAHFP
jgi:hypothetical protein